MSDNRDLWHIGRSNLHDRVVQDKESSWEDLGHFRRVRR